MLTKAVIKVPWSYLPRQFDHATVAAILERLGALACSGQFTLGDAVAEFEARFAELIGTAHAVGVNSGTDAIKLGLRAVGVGPGDEVITAANTFIGTAGAIVECGATPVLVDCTDDFCMDTRQVERAVTVRTKAIVPVHLTGQMVDMPALMQIAGRHAVAVVEDSCQCILGDIRGKKSGTFGSAGAFSLHPLKNLNVWGDGGMVVTDDPELASRLKRLRNHGLVDRDTHDTFGYNSRLDAVQALVGTYMIDRVDAVTSMRTGIAEYLDRALAGIPQITIPTRYPRSERRSVWHLYVVFAERRDALMAHLREAGVEAKVHYPIPLYRQPAVARLGHKDGCFPVADRHARTMISLPAHEHLTREELDYMVESVARFYA
jgi:dTDP-3-amino-2,3,6-trideoxy-4-keto-D-glucose/dTDP-3-amino-3,4,6-trideoxy-alpha-D-glucose/dTDP-2,6-dideoxy-D-kanosamine transaminase